MPKEYLNYLHLTKDVEGDERRYEMLNDILRSGTFLPKTLEYKDIDQAFTEWVRGLTIISDDGKAFPTMTLFSNQRFSEYSQTWQFVDENKNLLLNFKTITRENNPQYGNIQNGYWNIPGDRFYTMKRTKVLDDNGTESFLVLKMKQPVAIDLQYKVSIFTTKYSSLNEFNTLMNKLFAARQCYIQPNGHFIPMTLDSISDESQYNINDRQFYSQTYQIKVLGYIITEEDYRVDEQPLKIGGNLGFVASKHKKVEIEYEDFDYTPIATTGICGNVSKIYVPLDRNPENRRKIIDISELDCPKEELSKYYYKGYIFTFTLHKCQKEAEMGGEGMPFDFVLTAIEGKYASTKVVVNGESYDLKTTNPIIIRKGDTVRVSLRRGALLTENEIILKGYNPMIVLSEDIDYGDFEEPEEVALEEIEE